MSINVSEHKSLPFATYDIVVYLTTGFIFVFSTLFLFFGENFDDIIMSNSVQSISFYTVIITVTIILYSYVAGHFISFVSTYVIEKFIHRLIGFPSDVYLELSNLNIKDNSHYFHKKILETKLNFIYIVIFALNLPALPGYVLIYSFRAFGFYYPKIRQLYTLLSMA